MTINSGAQSRGKLRLEKSEDIHNTILENSETQNENKSESIPVYTVENSELDNLLEDATKTQEQEQQEQREETQAENDGVTMAEAMGLSLMALDQVISLVNDNTGRNITLGELPKTLFASLTAPLIQKYKPKIAIDPEGVDLDSWMPEILAAGGIAAAAVPMWWQCKSEPEQPENSQKKQEPAKNGD